MAYASIGYTNHNDIVCTLNNLSNDISAYSDVKFKLYYMGTNGIWYFAESFDDFGYNHSNSRSISHTFTSYTPDFRYAVRIFIKYNNLWYPDDPSVGYGFHDGVNDNGVNGETWDNTLFRIPAFPPPTITNQSATSTSITFTATVPFGSRSTMMWCKRYLEDSYGWVNVNNINNTVVFFPNGQAFNFSFTANGNSITFNGLPPNDYIYFNVRTFYNGYYSLSADNGYGFLVYSTSRLTLVEAPTVTSAETDKIHLTWATTYAPLYLIRVRKPDMTYLYFYTTINYGTVTGLVPDTLYQLSIAPVYEDIYGYRFYGNVYGDVTYKFTEAIITTPRLDTPTITIIDYSLDYITFTIGNVPNATYYHVGLYQNNNLRHSISVPNVGSYTFSDLIGGLEYEFRVYATDGVQYLDSYIGYTRQSTVVLATPELPTNIEINQVGLTSANITFDKGAYATDTDIDISSDGVNWGSIEYPNNINEDYTFDVGNYGLFYFRFRSRNYYDSNNYKYSEWSSNYQLTLVATRLLKYHNGSSWSGKPLKYFDGNSWVIKPMKTYINGGWL